jgi:putative hydrolase of HD superfamily
VSPQQPDDSQARGVASLIFETGALRRVPRTGWGYDGIQNAETVAEHSHRTAVIGLALAAWEGADPNRTAAMCVLHDLHEARVGDLTPLTKRYVTPSAGPREVNADQTANSHPAIQKFLAAAVDEFETNNTPEAQCAHDADKLDCIISAIEYREQGHPVQGKIDRCYAALKTDSARRVATAALEMEPTSWQSVFLAAPLEVEATT